MQKIVGSRMPDQASAQLKPSTDGYGENGWRGASSLLPGDSVSRSLDISPPKGDAALDIVKQTGSKAATPTVPQDSLSDTISKHNVPTNPGTSGASKGGTVPGSVAWNEGREVRKPVDD